MRRPSRRARGMGLAFVSISIAAARLAVGAGVHPLAFDSALARLSRMSLCLSFDFERLSRGLRPRPDVPLLVGSHITTCVCPLPALSYGKKERRVRPRI